MPRSSGSVNRQVAVPGAVPWFVIAIVATIPSGAVPGRIDVTSALNGPIPATARWAAIARPAIASPTASNTVPWTCELAESFRPSGLQRSHRPTSSATGAPQRAHGWVRAGLTGAGVTGALIAVDGAMAPRNASRSPGGPAAASPGSAAVADSALPAVDGV